MRVIRGLFMGGGNAAGVGSGFGVQFGHMIDILLGEASAVVDGGKFCRQ